MTARAARLLDRDGDTTILKDRTVSIGYIRLVPLIHPDGQPTLAPPPTPTPRRRRRPRRRPEQPGCEPAAGRAGVPGRRAVAPAATPARDAHGPSDLAQAQGRKVEIVLDRAKDVVGNLAGGAHLRDRAALRFERRLLQAAIHAALGCRLLFVFRDLAA